MRTRSIHPILTAFVLAGATAAFAPTRARAQVCTGTASIERTSAQAGTPLTLRVHGVARECGEVAIDAALGAVQRIESELGNWTNAVATAAGNTASAHARVPLTPELSGLFQEIDRWVTATDGAFDPAIGALIDAWDLDGAGRVPDESALRAARRATGWAYMVFDNQQATCGPSGWWLDTRAFGTGAALRAAAAALRDHGVRDAEIDFGSQRFVLGSRVVDVAGPAHATPAMLSIRDASIATTSAAHRSAAGGGSLVSRVLDPRTGLPVPAWGSVTVVAADALAADVLATALFVMGPDAALDWARGQNDVAVLVVTNDRGAVRARPNAAMAKLLITPSAPR